MWWVRWTVVRQVGAAGLIVTRRAGFGSCFFFPSFFFNAICFFTFWNSIRAGQHFMGILCCVCLVLWTLYFQESFFLDAGSIIMNECYTVLSSVNRDSSGTSMIRGPKETTPPGLETCKLGSRIWYVLRRIYLYSIILHYYFEVKYLVLFVVICGTDIISTRIIRTLLCTIFLYIHRSGAKYKVHHTPEYVSLKFSRRLLSLIIPVIFGNT